MLCVEDYVGCRRSCVQNYKYRVMWGIQGFANRAICTGLFVQSCVGVYGAMQGVQDYVNRAIRGVHGYVV